MTWKLFLDDERMPVGDDWVIARSSDAAIEIMTTRGLPHFISFDHDLGGDDTAMEVIHWIADSYFDGKLSIPDDFSFTVHSQNPIGKNNIEGFLDCFLDFIRD